MPELDREVPIFFFFFVLRSCNGLGSTSKNHRSFWQNVHNPRYMYVPTLAPKSKKKKTSKGRYLGKISIKTPR